MAQWKKIIVSGSDAELRTLTSSVSIGVGTNQIISTDPSLTKLSGSFSGSYYGDGSQLTGVTATGLNIDLFGSDLTGITVQPTDLTILSDAGTEGRITVSQLANPLTGTGLSEVSGKITLDTGSTHFTSGVKQKLNTDTVVSSSAQVVSLLPTGTVSGSSQVSYTGLSNIPSGIVSGSSQVDATQTTNFASGVKTQLDANTVLSGSSQVQFDSISGKPTLVSGSSQIDATQTTNFATGVKTQLDANTVVSGSSQVSYTGLSNIPSGIVSGSSQVDVTNTTNYSTLATTGSNIFVGNQVITGSMFITNNLVVQGSSSLEFITASAVSLGTNTIILNTDTPAVRFAGISVIDSGSGLGSSGSLWWDSLRNHWVYEHPSDSESDYNSAILIAGPKNYGSLGDETGLTSGSIPVATGTDHIENSVITQVVNNGDATVTVTGDLNIIGTLSATQISGIGGNIVSASLDSSTVDFTITSGVITANLIGGVVSGSSQVDATQTTNFATGVKTQLNSNTVISGSSQVQFLSVSGIPSGLVSGSSQVSYTGLSNIPSGIVSGAAQITPLLPTGVISGSSQVTSLLPTGVVSGSSQIDASQTTNWSTNVKNQLNSNTVISGSSQVSYTGLSNIPGGIVSGSSQVDATQTTNFATGVKTELNSNTVISGSSQVQLSSITGTTFANTPYSFPNNLTVDGNFTVNGTTTVISTTNLLVEDRFILLNSGSTNPDEGGLVIDEGNGQGHAFVYDSDSSRWGFTASLSSTANSVTPDAFAAAVVTTDIAEYRKAGNIRVDENGDIFIYV